MRFCLASAPTIAEFPDLDPIASEDSPRIPLGVLSLAAELARSGIVPEIVDVDRLNAEWRRGRVPAGDFASHAVAHLASMDVDVYGLSTLCGSYPLTLRIASALKRARPACPIVLGGPQATATAAETLAAFPAVDVVVRGEGERTLPPLLEALQGAQDLSTITGLTFRSADGIRRTADAALLQDLDSLALPDYGPYLAGARFGSVSLEVGRGCPCACTFCSTSLFFGRRFRMKSPARIVADMLALHRRFGARTFDLVHDNFTADRRRVTAFCEAVSSAAPRFTWTCSSRADALDEELVERMQAAGCQALFLGIESGSEAIQRSANKRLDLPQARALVRDLSRRGIQSTLSFITGFPDETLDDLRETVSFFIDALRQDHLEPQISILSPLAGTPLYLRHRRELVREGPLSDMAFQGEALDPADRSLIERHPDVFSSFYSVPTRSLDREELGELRTFLLRARFAVRWLLVAAAQLEGGGVEAFRAFRSWRRERGGGACLPRNDPSGDGLRVEFVRFAREDLMVRHPAARRALRALSSYYAAVGRRSRAAPPRRRAAAGPCLARNVFLTRIRCDGAALIHCLRNGGELSEVPNRPSVLVTRELPSLDRLVRITDEAAELLRLCDGTRTVSSIADEFRRRHRMVGGIAAEEAARYGLELFRRKRLVIWQRGVRRAAPGALAAPRAAGGRRPRPSRPSAPGPGPCAPRHAGRGARASGP